MVSVDFICVGLTGFALFIFRRREPAKAGFSAPGHPVTTGLFVVACALVVVATLVANPINSLFGFLILLAGVPACLYWQRKNSGGA